MNLGVSGIINSHAIFLSRVLQKRLEGRFLIIGHNNPFYHAKICSPAAAHTHRSAATLFESYDFEISPAA